MATSVMAPIRPIAEFHIDDGCCAKAWQFALDVWETVKDERTYRGQGDKNKNNRQDYMGKICEEAVFYLLEDEGYECSQPVDYNVYKAADKRHGADLKFIVDGLEHSISSKGMHTECINHYSLSWGFEKAYLKRAHVNLNEDRKSIHELAGCEFRPVNTLGGGVDVIIYTMIPFYLLLGNFEPPKNSNLGTKKFLYWDTVTKKFTKKQIRGFLE